MHEFGSEPSVYCQGGMSFQIFAPIWSHVYEKENKIIYKIKTFKL